ncbi:acyl-CoA dehydrogenase [Spectribacter hydrogenoxidans]|uniref:Acyl-coenzyme A dehydrogenase n=1 Tax=Spectribacter hydrogenoxidans TaxID=3075608 RepID=A0ABU3C349_9GAMM|nr:acyl-CoA dehydrogenase [Salinisphaera sp. W335]MDT0635984.1 acyl-CoA dehydrogenase [Salinisphaera sp. W335]
MFAKLLKTIKDARLLPQISDTERAALEAGTVWVDGEFFSGNPDFTSMLAEAYPKLPPEEQAFLDGPVEELWRMVDTWKIQETREVPADVWEFMRDKGFFGLIIPKEYGGFGMSTLGRAAVMMKTSGLGAVGSLVVIPNTLGAAELLMEYGTEAQKTEYLPRLASGEYVPCFGLTEPTAGSDAASIKAEGVVFKDDDGEVKIRLNFAKRYITLAPVANLVSVAAGIADPDNLLGKGEYPGISVVLVHKGTPGLELGDHHLPISAFDNGPIIGKDVVVSAENVIGGPGNVGEGWRMLMEQLSGGRAVSLPAGGIASCKLAAAAAGPYSMVRQQFNIPIGYMEGPEAKIAKIAAMAYAMESSRVYVCAGVDNGHQPPVASAILKQHTTEMGQRLVIDGLDVMAGAGVMQGPNNILGGAYIGAPVGVTVEGANILTRTLIIFGQGAVRCHPYALKTLRSLEDDDVPAFKSAVLGWMGSFAMNGLRTLVRGLTRGWSFRSPVKGPTARYYRKLGWASARFAFLTDLALFLVGAKLKQKGKLSGRFADALSWQLFAFTTLRRFEAEGRQAEDLPVVQWALEYSLKQIQDAFEGIYANFDAPVVGWLLRYPGRLLLRANTLSTGPSDKLDRPVANAIQVPGAQYDRIVDGLAMPDENQPGMGRLLKAWRLISEARPAQGKIMKAIKQGEITAREPAAALAEALEKGVVTAAEADTIRSAEAARMEAIQVDVFPKDEYYRNRQSGGDAVTMARAANA